MFASLFSSLFLVIQRSILLVFYPYKTLRKIAQENDYMQVGILLLSGGLYFFAANTVRPYPYHPGILFIVFLLHFSLTIVFFYFLAKIFQKDIKIKPFILTFAYTLIPTLIWFLANALLYALLPPPRTMSMLGKAFSIFFITFSASLLIWKIILWYLAIRFSSRIAFYRIIYLMLLYSCILAPYILLMYHFRIFRIPFI